MQKARPMPLWALTRTTRRLRHSSAGQGRQEIRPSKQGQGKKRFLLCKIQAFRPAHVARANIAKWLCMPFVQRAAEVKLNYCAR